MMGRLACMEQSEPGKRAEDSRYFPAYHQGRHSSLYPSTTSSIPLQAHHPSDVSLPRIASFDTRTHLPEGQRCASSFAGIPSLEQRARSSYRESSFSPSCASEVKEVRSSAVSPNLKLPPILSTKSASAPDTISMPPNNVLPMAPVVFSGYQEDHSKSSLMDMKLAYENMMVSYFMPQTIKSENAPIPNKQLTGEIPVEQNEAYVPCGYVGSYPITSMNELVKNCPCDDDYCVLQNIASNNSLHKGSTENKSGNNRKQFIGSTCGRQLTVQQSNVNHHTAMDVTTSGCTVLDRGNIAQYHQTSLSSTNGGQIFSEQNCSDSSIVVPSQSSSAIPCSEAQTSMSANEDQTSGDVSAVLNELSLLMPPPNSDELSGVYQSSNNTTSSFSSATTATFVNTTSSAKNSVSNLQYQNRSDSTWGRFSVLPPVVSSATPLGGCQHDGDNISVLSYNAFPNNAQNSPQMGMYYTPFSPFSVNFPDNISSALASSPRYSGRSSYSGKGSRNKRALSNSPLSAEGIDLNSIIRMSPTSLIAYINGSRSSSSCVSPGSAGDRTGCYGHLSARNSSSSPNSGSNSSSNRRSTSYTPQTATPGMSNSRSNPSNVTSDNSNVSVACCSNENTKNDYMTMDENLLVMQAMQELEAGAAMVGNGNTGFPFCSTMMHPAQMIPESENLQVLPQDIAAFTTEDFIPFIPSVLPPVHTHLQSHYQPAPSQALQTVSHNKPPPTYDQHMARKATLQKNSSSESSQPSNSSSFESSEGDKTVAGSGTDTETNRMYACRWLDCSAVFQDQDEFVTHIEKAHIDQKKGDEFICYWKLCPRRLHPFNARYKLLVHMRVHSGDKPNKCTYAGCKKAFSRLENLKIHLRSHTGERPYSCTYPGCTKTFSNSSDRTKHQKTHHDTKPYVCQVAGCGKRYTDPSSLRKHVKKSHPDKKEPDRKKIRGGVEEMDPKDLSECLMIQAIQPITLCDASPPEPTDSGLGRSPRGSQPGSSSDHYPGLIYTGEAPGRSETAQGSSCHTSPSSHHSSPPVQIERDKLPANNNSLRVPVLPPITPVPPQKQGLGVHIQGHAAKMRSSPNAPSVLTREFDGRGGTTLLQSDLRSQDPLHHVTGIYSSCSVRSGYRSADLAIPSNLNQSSRYGKGHS